MAGSIIINNCKIKFLSTLNLLFTKVINKKNCIKKIIPSQINTSTQINIDKAKYLIFEEIFSEKIFEIIIKDIKAKVSFLPKTSTSEN
jgi:hypothetical protein